MPALESVGYDELCVRVDPAGLTSARGDAIAYLEPTSTCHPDPPLDYAGIFNTGSVAPTRRSTRARYPESWWTEPFRSPPLYAALLQDVLCFGGLPFREHLAGHTLLARDRFIVPDSYMVRNLSRSLPTELIAGADGAGPARLASEVDLSQIALRPGLHYFAGAAWEQFGHFVLEGLARLWLLAHLPQSIRAELRVVLYNDRPLQAWQLELLAGLGITSDRLVYLTEPTRFERLLIPSIAYNLHREAAPAQTHTWERIGSAFERDEGPERVYLSRSRYPHNRVLLNESEVERQFQARGFTVIHPHELSIADQIACIRHARWIAGSAGSAMYSAAFARPGARVLIIAPRYFAFRDDQMISHLRGHRLAYMMCERDADPNDPRMADYTIESHAIDGTLERWLTDRA